jgi:spore germination cell wall hydrolase CwlJ-like protein
MDRYTRLAFIGIALFIILVIALVLTMNAKADIYDTTMPTTNVEEIETTAATELPTEPETEPTEITEPSTEPEPDLYETATDEVSVYENYKRDLELLACVIYQEAGGDAVCDDCRYRVADVVLNRLMDPRFPDTIHDVLTAESQYGRFHWTGVVWPDRASYESERHAVERAYEVAVDVLDGNHSELFGQGYIWQAEFVQGTGVIYCCGHYFGR